MLFNSLEFLLFFIIVTSLFFAIPHKFRWLWLLLASCFFYMAFVPVYILILFSTIIIDYFAGKFIEGATGKRRKNLLILSLFANIGILVLFKYYNFFIDNINSTLHIFNVAVQLPFLKMLLPIGLSFHTFQAMSYTIEVYRGNQKAEQHFGIYALYVMFYPQLVAGPIERPQSLLHQFHEKKKFNEDDFFIGIKMMLWGFFKKVVIADRVGVLVNHVYKSSDSSNATMLTIAAVFFAIQLYCDFSGYSTIALGAARTLGFRLMVNFKNPFNSVTISEFWTRWHISLSSWFKDYVFYPIATNKRDWGIWGSIFAVAVTYMASGIWHGAGWGYILWGALTGSLIIVEILLKIKPAKLKKSPLKKTLGILYVFIAFTLTGIFFRAASIADSLAIFKTIFSSHWGTLQYEEVFSKFSLILSVLLIVFLFFAETKFIDKVVESKLGEMKKTNLVFGIGILTLILLLGEFQKLSFIYFQF
jgi:alginate O-acetyltransferase complex protein AlgI